MRASTSRVAALAVLAVLVAAATGCASQSTAPAAGGPAPTTVSPSGATSETTAPTTLPAAVAAEPVKPVAGGSALHALILKAAMGQLGVSGSATVPQLFVQGSAAVGDLRPASGQRMVFAMTGGPRQWQVVWSAPFGSSQANAAALTKVDPTTFKDLARSLDFKSKVTETAAAAPTLAAFEGFALKSARNLAGTTYTGEFAIHARIAKDSTGTWWGNAIAEPSDTGLEPIGVWGRWNGTAWKGEIADFSAEGADAGYFPADVLAKLAL